MSLEHIFYLSQIIAALALVASLLFVALEVRNSNRERRHGAVRKRIKNFEKFSWKLPVMRILLEYGQKGFTILVR